MHFAIYQQNAKKFNEIELGYRTINIFSKFNKVN